MSDNKPDALIIGAGIVGLACAYELSKYGAKVTVIDMHEPGKGCSYGNAGWLTPCFALPLPMPGMLLKSLKWLSDPVSPLYIKPEFNITHFSWLIAFLRNMNARQANRSIAALTELAKFSLKQFANYKVELGMHFGFEQKGLLMVAQTNEGVSSAQLNMRIVGDHGIPGKFLNASEVKALEPSLTGPIRGGVYFPEEAHCEPFQIVQALAEAAKKRGVTILSNAEVYNFETTGKSIQAIETTRGRFEAKEFLLATGTWSNSLGKALGIRIPIRGGKGYAITVNSFDPSPKIPIMITERKIAVTPRNGSVRLAGTLELVDQDYSITTSRLNAIIEGSRQCFNFPKDLEITELWRGLRPCTPDGVPIIGYAKEFSNLFIATGHQMMGLKTAPGTARLAAEMMTKAKPSFDPNPFRADRF